MITVNPLPAFDDNYIWLIGQQQSPYIAIVDPGDGDAVLAYCQTHQLIPVAIMITHHHWDHTNGIGKIKQLFDIPVYGPDNPAISEITDPLNEGDQVHIPQIDACFEVIETPGHTLDHLCYVGHKRLFCGDTLFAAGCGRLFEGSAEQMQNSLAKIRALADETLIYCAHEYTLDNLAFAETAEPDNADIQQRCQHCETLRAQDLATVPSCLDDEKLSNPFLRWDHQPLIDAASRYSGETLDSPAKVFAAVRNWKDDLD